METTAYAYTSHVSPAQGFHFSWTTTLLPPHDRRCTSPTQTLALRFTLPPSIFADPYELDLHHASFDYDISYEPDLERPVWVVRQEPAILHVNATFASRVAAREGNDGYDKESLQVTVPIHARYGKPRSNESFEEIILEPPTATLYCDAGSGDVVSIPLAYLSSEEASAVGLSLRVPLGRIEDLHTVETGTALVVLGAFIYLSYVCIQVAHRLWSRERAGIKQE